MNHKDLKLKYDAKFYSQVQELTMLRKKKYSQQQMAEFCNVSTKTVQKFESYDCQDGFILNVYGTILHHFNKLL